MGSKIVAGYVRVSTREQNPELQRSALQSYVASRNVDAFPEFAGGLELYEDIGVSGARGRRPALDRLLADAHRGRIRIVLVWKFDRFSRSVQDLLTSLTTFQQLGIDFVSVTEGIDTTTAAGRMVFTFLGALAEFERSLIRERVQAGVAAARARGKPWGRPRKLSARTLVRAQELRRQGYATRAIARTLKVKPTTLRRSLGLDGRS